MKYLVLFLFLFVVLSPGAQAQKRHKRSYDTLIWSDEFDGRGLPDPARWGYEKGFVRNEEAQFYTVGRQQNAEVRDGYLVITARKERINNPRYDTTKQDWIHSREYADYTSASVTTEGKFAVRYGRIEARAKVPDGLGTWPAIWLLGTNIPLVGWPRCGEIDIMEFLGHDSVKVYGTCHWATKNGKRKSQGRNISVQPPPPADFHIYAIDWTPRRIRFYYDERKYFSFRIPKAGGGSDNPFRQPFFMIINLALGGWGGKIDDSSLPQKFLIDYVRVYGKE